MNLILWLWQAPQNLVGLVLRLLFRGRLVEFRGRLFRYVPKFPGGGISLGSTVIVRYSLRQAPKVYAHEYGHTRQSLFLGPFYLLVIGIPSFLWACYHKRDKRKSYYWFYTERWADRLGGVKRG